jgi:photosystem II stability/assembly factor-like uncharacterized protein
MRNILVAATVLASMALGHRAEAKLRAVWGSSAENVFAAGDGAAILHSADHGATWSLQITPTVGDILALWGRGPRDVYALARARDRRSSQLLQWNGTAWSLVARINKEATSIWGKGRRDLFVAGQNFVLHTRDGGRTWSTQRPAHNASRALPFPAPRRGDLIAVYQAGPEVFAVDQRGKLVHSWDRGASWE